MLNQISFAKTEISSEEWRRESWTGTLSVERGWSSASANDSAGNRCTMRSFSSVGDCFDCRLGCSGTYVSRGETHRSLLLISEMQINWKVLPFLALCCFVTNGPTFDYRLEKLIFIIFLICDGTSWIPIVGQISSVWRFEVLQIKVGNPLGGESKHNPHLTLNALKPFRKWRVTVTAEPSVTVFYRAWGETCPLRSSHK